MNIPLIQEDKQQAQAKLREYRKAIHTRADKEYELAAAAYGQLAKGRPLIRLTEAFATAPLDDAGRVRLGLAPATWKQVTLSTPRNGVWQFNHVTSWHRRIWRQSIDDSRALGDRSYGFALVPMIPPDVRGTHDLGMCCILWEVEQWAARVIRAGPDRDPLLIRRIGDDLYVVLGEWELTPLEQAIMAGRRSA